MADKVVERRDVWVLSEESVWHPTIEWYARAVGAMKKRDTPDLADPTSFAHVAAIHGTNLTGSRWAAGAELHECQHSSWSHRRAMAVGAGAILLFVLLLYAAFAIPRLL